MGEVKESLERICLEQAELIEAQALLIRELTTQVAQLTTVLEGEKE